MKPSRSVVQAVHLATGSGYGKGIPRSAPGWRLAVAVYWRRYRSRPAGRQYLAGLVKGYREIRQHVQNP